jgi:putative oxidoreductase
VQRYFSTFPGSWPGVGLLLLRIVVGGAASMQGAVYLTHVNEPNGLTWTAGGLAVVSGVALVAGFLTPASGAVAGLATLFIVATWTPPSASVLIDRLAALILIVDAGALALLGPGALSLDARLFGRREIIIPHDPLT